MTAPRLRDFAEGYTAAWCSRDPARVADFYSVNGSLRVNGGAAAMGRVAITEVARGFMTAFPDLAVALGEVSGEGDRAVYHWTLTGTYASTGKRVRISGYEEWRMGADGKIAESLGHFDEADYQRQLERGFEQSS